MLRQQLQTDQLSALKSHDKVRLETLRYVISEIKNKEIEKNPPVGGELSDEETLNTLQKVAKRLQEAIVSFNKANRKDLSQEYQNQLDIITSYLPAKLTDEQLKTEIEKLRLENQGIIQKNPKAIIGICMKKLRNMAEPEKIIALLSQ